MRAENILVICNIYMLYYILWYTITDLMVRLCGVSEHFCSKGYSVMLLTYRFNFRLHAFFIGLLFQWWEYSAITAQILCGMWSPNGIDFRYNYKATTLPTTCTV